VEFSAAWPKGNSRPEPVAHDPAPNQPLTGCHNLFDHLVDQYAATLGSHYANCTPLRRPGEKSDQQV